MSAAASGALIFGDVYLLFGHMEDEQITQIFVRQSGLYRKQAHLRLITRQIGNGCPSQEYRETALSPHQLDLAAPADQCALGFSAYQALLRPAFLPTPATTGGGGVAGAATTGAGTGAGLVLAVPTANSLMRHLARWWPRHRPRHRRWRASKLREASAELNSTSTFRELAEQNGGANDPAATHVVGQLSDIQPE